MRLGIILRPLLLAGAAIIAAPAGIGSATAASGATHVVTLKNIAFTPATMRIRVGQKVTWKWADGPYVDHNLHSVGKNRFPGATARKTGIHTVRFTRRGTYRYQCTLHPGMTGRVIVS